MRSDPQNRPRFWLAVGTAHGVLSVGAFWLVSIAGLAAADSNLAAVPGWLVLVERIVRFVLLQPLAYWILALLDVRYWTWPGLALSTLLIATNSVVVILAARALARRFRRS